MGKLIERYSFGSIKERGVMPHFLEFQLDSYEDFLQTRKAPDQREVDGFINKVLSEEKDFELKFTDEELSELIDVNSGIDASVNGVKLKSEDFLEQVYIMFS